MVPGRSAMGTEDARTQVASWETVAARSSEVERSQEANQGEVLEERKYYRTMLS